ncbi:stromal interaction molecule homolog [Argonauta hians]
MSTTPEMGIFTRVWLTLIFLSFVSVNIRNIFCLAEKKYSNSHHSSSSSSSSPSVNDDDSNNRTNNINSNNDNTRNNNKHNNDNDTNKIPNRTSKDDTWTEGAPASHTGSKQAQHQHSSKKKLEDFKELECEEHNPTCLKDRENFNSIKTLHDLIDDDRNGNVDQTESDEFLRVRVELQYTDGFERHFTFHGNDRFISVEDLWKSWKQSEVYNWTIDDVVDWLVHHVELPQYVSNFQTHKIDGSTLPRVAASYQYLNTIGIKNNVHKQKLCLKSKDVVLFGPPKKGHSYIKDLTLIASLIIAIGGCWFAYLQHKYSQEHVKKMMKDWESLQIAEESLKELQERLDKAQQDQSIGERLKDYAMEPESNMNVVRRNSSSNKCHGKIEEEMKQLKADLKRAEKELESRQWSSAPVSLQKWLQLTYEIELQYHNEKKCAAEKQLQEARDCCEKLKKKRNAFMGPLRIAHGNSIDEVDKRILNARASLETVHEDLQERLIRWKAIERLCAFSVSKNAGIVSLMQMTHQDRSNPVFTSKPVPAKDLQTYPQSLTGSLTRRTIDATSNHSGSTTPTSPESEVTFHLGEGSPQSFSREEASSLPPSYSTVNASATKAYPSNTYLPATKSEGLIRTRLENIISSSSETSLVDLDQRKHSESGLKQTGPTFHFPLEEGVESESESTGSFEDKKKSKTKKVLGKIFRRN